MTDTTGALNDVVLFDCLPVRQGISQRVVVGAFALAIGFAAATVGWLIAPVQVTHPSTDEKPAVAPAPTIPVVLDNPYGALAGVKHFSDLAPILTDPGFALDLFLDEELSPPDATPTGADASLQTLLSPDTGQGVPLPPARPPLFRPPSSRERLNPPARQVVMQPAKLSAAPATPDNRSFFQKLFDIPAQSSSSALAYAEPEDGKIGGLPAFGKFGTSAPYDQFTAVYDVAAHVVYMPNGDRLEAHSGLGDLLDDPRHVDAKDRGATPPHLYDLELRKDLFHGVQALRLDPVGSGTMYGRTGLLAHTYMLGPKGDSNGCVSFRDYAKFLDAFVNGQIKHLAVVARLG